MPIIKNNNRKRFTRFDNQLLDSGLSPAGLGLLVYLLSKPSEWEPAIHDIRRQFNVGRDKAYTMLQELKEKGFAEYSRANDGSTSWIIFESVGMQPYTENTDEGTDPHPEKAHEGIKQPHPEKPDLEKPDLDNPHVLVTTERAVTTKTIVTTEKPTHVIPDFVDGELWIGFIENRKDLKKPATDRAITMLINRMNKFHDNGVDVNECLRVSITAGWSSIFEPKGKRSNVRTKTGLSQQGEDAIAIAMGMGDL